MSQKADAHEYCDLFGLKTIQQKCGTQAGIFFTEVGWGKNNVF